MSCPNKTVLIIFQFLNSKSGTELTKHTLKSLRLTVHRCPFLKELTLQLVKILHSETEIMKSSRILGPGCVFKILS